MIDAVGKMYFSAAFFLEQRESFIFQWQIV